MSRGSSADLPELVAEGNFQLAVALVNDGRFMAHNFFTEQPFKGADV